RRLNPSRFFLEPFISLTRVLNQPKTDDRGQRKLSDTSDSVRNSASSLNTATRSRNVSNGLLDVRAVADLLGVSASWVRRHISELPCVPHGPNGALRLRIAFPPTAGENARRGIVETGKDRYVFSVSTRFRLPKGSQCEGVVRAYS